jgi:hypothetical protein
MEAELQIAVMIKPYVKMSRMSNQWKAEIGSDIFLCEESGEIMVKFCQNLFYTGRYDLPEILF